MTFVIVFVIGVIINIFISFVSSILNMNLDCCYTSVCNIIVFNNYNTKTFRFFHIGITDLNKNP